jgi:hypothetical protein
MARNKKVVLNNQQRYIIESRIGRTQAGAEWLYRIDLISKGDYQSVIKQQKEEKDRRV